ncbi:MAG: peptide-methionine (R)-S-oxide reductase MsrB [Pseudomonadales bacterium]|nr:peptide-methionine (R)-S-oxide reductase MsrB [Pseudomonadales bacterium]
MSKSEGKEGLSENQNDDKWRNELSDEAYEITRKAGTEAAFTGKYWDTKTPGIYQCVCCAAELFESDTKYDSGSGWPSFYAPIKQEVLATKTDGTRGMQRTEVLCATCDAHLGHVFPDGPQPTGLRFCMNSASLNLVASEE